MHGQLWWYVARSGGLLAWGLLAASVLWGLVMTTRLAAKLAPRPAWFLDLHRFLGGAALVFTVIHVTGILLDAYVHFGLVNVLVPMTGTWHPGAVAWGIVGLYLLSAVEVTSLARSRIPQRLWRQIHYVSFPLFIITTIHTLTAGTDRHNPLVLWGVIAICVPVTLLTALRLALAGKAVQAKPARPAPLREF